ncbi:MAG: acyl-CoA dehydrogenase family protein [Sphingomonadales bacterium]
MSFQRQTAAILAQLAIVPGIERLRALTPGGELSDELLSAIVEEAARLSEERLAPFNARSDRSGCTIEGGRVRTSADQRETWAEYVAGGWPTLTASPEHGGQGLPLLVQAACEELFNRGSTALMMLATAGRCAARLMAEYAGEEIKAEWLPRLASGEWGATICVSEPDAGSDLARIRTSAEPQPDGSWRVSGEKIWISFGDHDLSERIGHLVLARTPGAPAGTRGISLFLVPNLIDGAPNGVVVRRIEEKLGLHASPTCALGFEQARGRLIGEPHRGLPQMFAMIVAMRISVGSQGVGIGTLAAETALDYAFERRQGGSPDAPAVPIAEHADVQRMLLDMTSRVEVVRGLVLACAACADLAERETEEAARAEAAALLGWLLPIAKNFSAETGFEAASQAIQVLGGAGYTREWPVEQALRDSRVLAIFEGTSGMQALDLVQRRLLRGGEGLAAFLRAARRDIAARYATAEAEALAAVLDTLEAASRQFAAWQDKPRAVEAGAYHYLTLASLAATGWIALRLAGLGGTTPAEQRIAASGRFWLSDLPARAELEAQLATAGEQRLSGFSTLRALHP